MRIVLVLFGKYPSMFKSNVSVQTPLLTVLRSMPEHPESFPVNALVPIKGTPLEDNEVSYAWHVILRQD